MNGLNDMLASARDGLCGSGHCMRHGPDYSRSWRRWSNEVPPPIPRVIHVTETQDEGFDQEDDDDLLGLDFADHISLLPTDLLLELSTAQLEGQRGGFASPVLLESQPHFPRQPSGCRDGSENRLHSTTSSLSASTDTDNAQILYAWTTNKPHASPNTPIDARPATMAYILPFRHRDYTNSPRLLDNVDGSSYSSTECPYFWSAQPSSFSPPDKTETAPTEASSTASC